MSKCGLTRESGISRESICKIKGGFIYPTMSNLADYGPKHACIAPFISVVRQFDTRPESPQTCV
jgi:hypothetical protein